MRTLRIAAACVALFGAAVLAADQPYWMEPMRRVHGGPGRGTLYVAQLGDSITYSMAFWAPLEWADPTPYITQDGLPKVPGTARWRDVITGCRDKGQENGNFSGWRVTSIVGVVDHVLATKHPDAAILMVGTNDVAGGTVPTRYREELENVVRKCLAARCIPILNTIPPRRGQVKAVEETNKIIRDVAVRFSIPLVDYYAEILRLQPGNAWDGTLIDRDGVHPTAGRTQDYSAANLKASGYALRNWLNFLMVRELYFAILGPVRVPRSGGPPKPSSNPYDKVIR